MIILSRAPLRVSLAGGGSDLPWFESLHGSRFIASAIDKYVTVIVSKRADDKIRVAYSKTELVDDASQLEHPILRHVLANRQGLEVHTMADVPANTGLGSSGAFTVALDAALNALDGRTHRQNDWELTWQAYFDERAVDPNVGWQDHAAAAMGGTRLFSHDPTVVGDKFPHAGTPVDVRGLDDLELWYTGTTRKAADVLEAQAADQNATSMLLLRSLVDRVLQGEPIGRIFDRHHQLKVATAPGVMTTGEIEQHIHAARAAGAVGVKLVGAGGGGFLLVAMPTEQYNGDPRFGIRTTLETRGLKRLPVRFGVPGVEVLRW